MNVINNLQLAKTIKIKDVKFPCRAEIKTDGVRMFNWEKYSSWYTRSGKRLPFKTFTTDASNYFLDVEITLESGKMEDRSKIIGLTNSLMRGGDINESLLRFNIFDSMLASHMINEYCPDTLKERVARTKNIVDHWNDPRVRMFKHKDCFNLMELTEYYEKALADGYEGLVIKYYKDTYQFKKSKHWGKIKPRDTADLICVDTTEGKGKYAGMVGSLICEGEVEGKSVRVKVGSGMKTEDHDKSPWYYVGKTIELEYSHVTKAMNKDIHSLNQPTFVCVREDK